MTPIISIKSNKREVKSYFGMVVLVFIATSVIFALGFRKDEKPIIPPMKMKVEMVGMEWAKADKWISISKNALSKSDLPAKDVNMILDSLTTFQNELYKQLSPQFKLEDSLSKIKPK